MTIEQWNEIQIVKITFQRGAIHIVRIHKGEGDVSEKRIFAWKERALLSTGTYGMPSLYSHKNAFYL